MFRVGEETGTLDDQLELAAAYYNREVDVRLKRFTSLFEPAVIVFMGLIVGFVAVALVSAMYGIYHQVHVS
jgi:type IV pilus assembly protein PilC